MTQQPTDNMTHPEDVEQLQALGVPLRAYWEEVECGNQFNHQCPNFIGCKDMVNTHHLPARSGICLVPRQATDVLLRIANDPVVLLK